MALLAGMVPAQTANTCAIDGSVLNAGTGEPVPRAQLTAITKSGQFTAVADNAGHWHFSGLTCGQTQVTARRPGFLGGGLGQPRIGAAFRPVILTADAPVHDAKILLTPQGVVTGKVVDDQGDPLMNVSVTAMAAVVIEGRRTFQGAGSVGTNDLGEYRIPGLPGARYIICAHANGPFNAPGGQGGVPGDMTATVVQERCFPGPVEGGAASAMEISGTTARVDFTLSRAPAVKIRGTLSGSPGRGAALSLFKRLPNVATRVGAAADVAQDGRFEIRGVTPGSYMLSTDYWESGKRLIARVPLEVGGADVEGVVVKLEPGFSITGTVRTESTRAASPNARQANLLLKSTDHMAGGGQMIWSKNRDAFTISEITPGSYSMEVPNGPFYLKSAMLGGRDLSKEEIPITQSAGPVEVVLSDNTGSIGGRVEGADGKPVSCWVMVLPGALPMRPPRNIMSEADGHFTVPNLPPGEYKVYAWDDWQNVEYANPEWMQRNASGVPATVEGGQSAQVGLRQQMVPVQ